MTEINNTTPISIENIINGSYTNISFEQGQAFCTKDIFIISVVFIIVLIVSILIPKSPGFKYLNKNNYDKRDSLLNFN